MKTRNLFGTVLLLLAASAFVMISCSKEPVSDVNAPGDFQPVNSLKSGNNGAASYIVILNEGFEAAGELAGKQDYDQRKVVMNGYLNRFLNGKGVGNDQVDHTYTTVFMGFAARLSANQLEKLRQDPMVKSIEPDGLIELGKPPVSVVTQPAEVMPWGITRVGGGVTYSGTAKVWIIDTGVDFTHPDLNVNTLLSKSFVLRIKTANDDNGHGSHVAGIIAAKDNTIGVVGVAAGASVVAVKVLDKLGNGTISAVLAGIDYVTRSASSGDVVNMSLGGGVNTTLDAAVLAMSANVKVALAAGNESDDANNHSPARVNGANIYTVSAMGTGDTWASFSNFGNPPIDYCAPGVSIYSCYKGGGYATMSGTSMAAPHVAGLLLLGAITTDKYVIGDPDGKADPIAHK
jgi:subtilisin family serine protease